MNSLDPLEKMSDQAVEIGQHHTEMSRKQLLTRFRDIFNIVGLQESRIDDYPHEFSGGMSQRAIIALALFLRPSIIIADEPTTALDVIMQDQIFKYLERVQQERDQAMMLITHDISVVLETCDSMAIMHGGQVAETGSVRTLYTNLDTPILFYFKKHSLTSDILIESSQLLMGLHRSLLGRLPGVLLLTAARGLLKNAVREHHHLRQLNQRVTTIRYRVSVRVRYINCLRETTPLTRMTVRLIEHY